MALGYCIYLRKSRADMEAESRGEGETLARHEKILLDLANKMQIGITQTYREIVSGETISSRPVMQQLLTEVEQRLWTGVLVVEIERLARGDTVDQGIVAQSFKYSDTKIITPMKVYDPRNAFDEEYFEFGLFMSRREYKTINRRLQRGRIESVKEGKYLGTTPPYGYIRKKLVHDKGYSLAIHPQQADVVRFIFNLYSQGNIPSNGTSTPLGVSSIAKQLNKLNIKPLRSDKWVASTIRSMLRNPVYIGKIRWNARPEVKKMIDGKLIKIRPRAKQKNWILVDGLHEAIIDTHVYNLVQHRLSKNTPAPVPTGLTIKNPLAGLIVCGLCGRKMVRRPYSNGYPDALICPVPSCKNISSKLTVIEKKLMDALQNWLAAYQLNLACNSHPTIQHNPFHHDMAKKNIRKLEQELVVLEGQRDNLHDLLEQGIYTAEKFSERYNVITAKIQIINDQRNDLLGLFVEHETIHDNRKTPIFKVEKILQIYNNLSNASAKNLLLKEVLEKVEYIKTVNGRWHHHADDFELLIFPKLPKEITIT
ncbi:recombinase family protein [Vallitalea pronyensis]|uniref:Recombinase family protein n=1 Tax=Vallitalea pronyensis TaxID=1348613 RepID=A0A8J8MJT9_9FIRM|nr:recombinase family protein [Vallitalea pronyensis]QUI22583.1 recombinase family protein [Vallitalea pronyensis]